MRRSEKEILDKPTLEKIISESIVCRIGLSDGNKPYIVPVCFGYEEGIFYFHSALEGRKIGILKNNNQVCLQFETNLEVKSGTTACEWSMKYKSVIAFGKAVLIEEIEEKKKALQIIMNQYTEGSFTFSEESVRKTAVFKVLIEKMTGKQSGY